MRLPLCFILIFLDLCLPGFVFSETKTWTGNGSDGRWSNSLNWSGNVLPSGSDEVLLDNRFLPLSYTVTLPDEAVFLRSLKILPSPGNQVELILPQTNRTCPAFSVTGPGYGLELAAGAVFRNASGLSSGESLSILDSLIIRDGGRYIHQTRASHASRILGVLSTAPGTEDGVFDFDVPRASYTVSVSNRIYGSLEFHALANGNPVNYTCTGANPLLIRGNLRVDRNVNLSIDLSGIRGNIQIEKDFFQDGGIINLAAGANNQTVLGIRGNLYQSPSALITATLTSNPWLELNGMLEQTIAMAGLIQGQTGFRMNNIHGARMSLPLILPWRLELKQGVIRSSAASMLILDSHCRVLADSSNIMGSHVKGPLRKRCVEDSGNFLFPVGDESGLRWMELKQAKGDYTVEYKRENPAVLGRNISSGLAHISTVEYWKVDHVGLVNPYTRIELSFASDQSGGVTDPQYLHIAGFLDDQWQDAGQSLFTGNWQQGAVVSDTTDMSPAFFTLASTVDLENPLPLVSINLIVYEENELPVYEWTVDTDLKPKNFDLYELKTDTAILIRRFGALQGSRRYTWIGDKLFPRGRHYFQIRMIDADNVITMGKIFLFDQQQKEGKLFWVPAMAGRQGLLAIQSQTKTETSYEVFSSGGKKMAEGTLHLGEGIVYLATDQWRLKRGWFLFTMLDKKGIRLSQWFNPD